MVDRRCATTKVVRPRISRSSEAWIARSDSESSAEVASSSSRMGASLSSARAIDRRWRCPPDSLTAFSPMREAKPCGSDSMKGKR